EADLQARARRHLDPPQLPAELLEGPAALLLQRPRAQLRVLHAVEDVLAALELAADQPRRVAPLLLVHPLELPREELDGAEGRAELVGRARGQGAEGGDVAIFPGLAAQPLELAPLLGEHPGDA